MTKKEREELNKLRLAEFMSDDEEKMLKSYEAMGKQLEMAQKGMGLSRFEAIYFLGVMLGNAIRSN